MRLLEPAFSEKNRRLSISIIMGAVLWIVATFPDMVHFDQPQIVAVAEIEFRDQVMKRMREACFTPEQIRILWYEKGYLKNPKVLLLLVKGREALCGGRGKCVCEESYY